MFIIFFTYDKNRFLLSFVLFFLTFFSIWSLLFLNCCILGPAFAKLYIVSYKLIVACDVRFKVTFDLENESQLNLVTFCFS